MGNALPTVSQPQTSSFREELLHSEKAAAAELRASALDRQKHRVTVADLSVSILSVDELVVEGDTAVVYVEVLVEGEASATPCARLGATLLRTPHQGRASWGASGSLITRQLTDITGDVRVLVWQRAVASDRPEVQDPPTGGSKRQRGDILVGQVIVPLTSCVDVERGGSAGAEESVVSVGVELARSVVSGVVHSLRRPARRSRQRGAEAEGLCGGASAASAALPSTANATSKRDIDTELAAAGTVLALDGEFWINRMPPPRTVQPSALVAARKFDPTLGHATSIIKSSFGARDADATSAVIQRTTATLLSGVQELLRENYSLTRKHKRAPPRGERGVAAEREKVRPVRPAGIARATATDVRPRGARTQMPATSRLAASYEEPSPLARRAAGGGGAFVRRPRSSSYSGTLADMVTAGGWEDISPEGQDRFLAARRLQAHARGRAVRKRVGLRGARRTRRGTHVSAAALAAQLVRAKRRRGRLALRLAVALRPSCPHRASAYWASPPARACEWPATPPTFDHNHAIQAGVRLRHSVGLRALLRGRTALLSGLLLAASWRDRRYSAFVCAWWCYACVGAAWWHFPFLLALLVAATALAMRPTAEDQRTRYTELVADADGRNASRSELSELTYLYSRLALLQEWAFAALTAIENASNLLAFADARVSVCALSLVVGLGALLTLVLGALALLGARLGAPRATALAGLFVLLAPTVVWPVALAPLLRRGARRGKMRRFLNGLRNFAARVPGELELLHRHTAMQQQRMPRKAPRRLALSGLEARAGDGVLRRAGDAAAQLAGDNCSAGDSSTGYGSSTGDGAADGAAAANSALVLGGEHAAWAPLCGVFEAVDCDADVHDAMPLLRELGSTPVVIVGEDEDDDAATTADVGALVHPWLGGVSFTRAWLARLDDGRWAVGPSPRLVDPAKRGAGSGAGSVGSGAAHSSAASVHHGAECAGSVRGDEPWLISIESDDGARSGPVGLTWSIVREPTAAGGAKALGKGWTIGRKHDAVYVPAPGVEVVVAPPAAAAEAAANGSAAATAALAAKEHRVSILQSPRPSRGRAPHDAAGAYTTPPRSGGGSSVGGIGAVLRRGDEVASDARWRASRQPPRAAIEAAHIIERVLHTDSPIAAHTEFVVAVSRARGGGNVVVKRYSQFAALYARLAALRPRLAALRRFVFPPKWTVVQSIEVALSKGGEGSAAMEDRVAALNDFLVRLIATARGRDALLEFLG